MGSFGNRLAQGFWWGAVKLVTDVVDGLREVLHCWCRCSVYVVCVMWEIRDLAMRQELYTHGKHLVQKLAESGRCGLNGLGFDVVRSERAEQD
jgi:hypothetical protein